MKDPLKETHKGLGRKPSTTRRIRTGWCGFCRQVAPLTRIRGIGYLCPTCGGHLFGDAPEITRYIFKG